MSAELSTRDSIFGLIEENPGIHFREIQRRSGLAVGQVEYHLYQLEREQRIVTREDGKVKRYFCSTEESYTERQILFYLRSNASNEVLQKLAHSGRVTLFELMKVRKSKLDKRKKAIDDMARDRIISINDVDSVSYVEIKDLTQVLDIARKYRQSFVDTLSDNFLSLMGES